MPNMIKEFEPKEKQIIEKEKTLMLPPIIKTKHLAIKVPEEFNDNYKNSIFGMGMSKW